MNEKNYLTTAGLLVGTFFLLSQVNANSEINRSDVLKIGKTIPNAQLNRFGQANIQIDDFKGKIKIISVVPKLNTPVCDKQTHQFSEKNGGLDKRVDIITISTNTPQGQDDFAKKAVRFCENAPEKHRRDPETLALATQAQQVVRALDKVLGTGNMQGAQLELSTRSLHPGHITGRQGTGET